MLPRAHFDGVMRLFLPSSEFRSACGLHTGSREGSKGSRATLQHVPGRRVRSAVWVVGRDWRSADYGRWTTTVQSDGKKTSEGSRGSREGSQCLASGSTTRSWRSINNNRHAAKKHDDGRVVEWRVLCSCGRCCGGGSRWCVKSTIVVGGSGCLTPPAALVLPAFFHDTAVH